MISAIQPIGYVKIQGSYRGFGLLVTFLMCLMTLNLDAQVEHSDVAPSSLFESDEILELKLVGNVRDLIADRTGPARDFTFELFELTSGKSEIRHLVDIKTRGHYRRIKGNCSYPPLQLDFPKGQVSAISAFSQQNKLKLVMPCQGEKYVLREYLVYKMYNQVTPYSFRARLVKLSFVEKENGKIRMSVMGILLEDEEQMASRNLSRVIEKDLVRPEQIQEDHFARVAIFQFMIGNTDWSVQYRQNIKILEETVSGVPNLVPYDFDHAGMVKAPYARPAPELQLSSVAVRRYRGYCVEHLELFSNTLNIFKEKKPELYKVIQKALYLDQGSRKYCAKYLDGFFKIIEREKLWQKAFSYPCITDGTGNIVIKGLREN